MRISIVGTGYVGLVTGACLSDLGNTVTCTDVVKEKIECVTQKKSPIFEEGLEELLKKNVGKTLFATQDLEKAVLSSDITFICVGTPSKKDGSIDLHYVEEAIRNITEIIRKKETYHVIVIKSTVIPGTTEKVRDRISQSVKNFGICMNPEFLREGKAVHDFFHPERIVIGENDKKSGDVLFSLYKDFSCPILRVDLRTAEMIKYASNAFLAAKVSFMNEIGNICKNLDIDVYKVAEGMGLDSRISPKFLEAGCGFGGSCFPKDLRAFIAQAGEQGYTPFLLESVLKINESQPLKMVELLKKRMNLKNKKIGVLGLAFKPGTDDVRESPALKIIQMLLEEKCEVYAYDPEAIKNMKKVFPTVTYLSGQEVISQTEAVLIVTGWEEFKHLDYKDRLVIDGRRILQREDENYEGLCW